MCVIKFMNIGGGGWLLAIWNIRHIHLWASLQLEYIQSTIWKSGKWKHARGDGDCLGRVVYYVQLRGIIIGEFWWLSPIKYTIQLPNYLIHCVLRVHIIAYKQWRGCYFNPFIYYNELKKIRKVKSKDEKNPTASRDATFVCKRNPSKNHAHITRDWEWWWGNISFVSQHNPRKRPTFTHASTATTHNMFTFHPNPLSHTVDQI